MRRWDWLAGAAAAGALLAGVCAFAQPAPTTQHAQPAQMLEPAHPEYPPKAMRADEEGTVHVRVRVLATGEPSEVQVQRSSGSPELDRAAVTAAGQSKFRAAQNEAGAFVDSWSIVPYKFVLVDAPRRGPASSGQESSPQPATCPSCSVSGP